jgi:hypothetical protein
MSDQLYIKARNLQFLQSKNFIYWLYAIHTLSLDQLLMGRSILHLTKNQNNAVYKNNLCAVSNLYVWTKPYILFILSKIFA